jgi:dTDP-4-amino-4,6-dideoxygalactose transaminase
MSKIFVTEPSLPELNDFVVKLQEIWKTKQLTNNGKFIGSFEEELKNYLNVSNLSLMSNGTLALLIGIKAFDLKGEVITTPYSFVATTHVLEWLNLKPVFCDIEPDTCNINPKKIEELITENTSAILPVHVYGNPCDHQKIQKIADKYNLKVIYDAAHAFGVEKDGESILNWGDASILSFHATKVFNTIEGGAIVVGDNCNEGARERQCEGANKLTSSETSNDRARVRRCDGAINSQDAIQSPITNHQSLIRKCELLRNFGIVDEDNIELAGLNAKMNELIAAYGLLQLETIDEEIEKRKLITQRY